MELFWVLHHRLQIANKHKAVCQSCTKQLSHSTTTTDLQTHLQSCHPCEAVEAKAPNTSGAARVLSSVQPCMTAYYLAHSASAGPLPMAKQTNTVY